MGQLTTMVDLDHDTTLCKERVASVVWTCSEVGHGPQLDRRGS